MFHMCPSCKFVWSARAEFLSDPGVDLIAYKVSFTHLVAGVFLFRHRCKGVLTLHAGEFLDLYSGPVFDAPLTGSESCPGYCLRQDELRPCPAKCECAFVREIVQIVKVWPKCTESDIEMISRLAPPL